MFKTFHGHAIIQPGGPLDVEAEALGELQRHIQKINSEVFHERPGVSTSTNQCLGFENDRRAINPSP